MKFGNEAWVLNKREEQRLEAAQMKFLRHLLGITKLDIEKNQCIRQKTGAQNILKESMKREDQKDATMRCLLLTSVSKCFRHHYAHLQENNSPVTAFGVLFWFCWMWLLAVVMRCLAGCEHM